MARNDMNGDRQPGSIDGKAPKKSAKKRDVKVVDLSEPKNKKRRLFPFGGKSNKPFRQKPAKKPNAKKGKGSGVISKIAYIALVAAAVIALAFMLLNQDSGGASNPASYLGSVFAPVQDALSSATKFVRDIVTGAMNYVSLVEENARYKQDIIELKIQLSLTADDASEKERLQKLLDVKNSYDTLSPVYAKVIAKDPGVWFDTFSINKGTSDGIKTNMSVITGDGLAGRIYEVGLNYSKVMSVIDSRSAVACLIERTRDNGVMRGKITSESSSSECNMYYLPVVNDIIPGDTVLTSGVDMLFPKGLTVGAVSSVSRQSDLSDQYIVVLPAVDFLHLEDVLVLRTEVETNTGEAMPVLFTPTPRPTIEASPSPTPQQAEVNVDDEDAIWRYPSSVTNPGSSDATPGPSATPAPTFDPDSMPVEDAWSIGG